jgi:omega-amidase
MKVAAIQADLVWEDKAANLLKFEHIFKSLEIDTQMVFLPEMFSTGFTMQSEKFAETIQGDTVSWMKNMCQVYQLAITGSIIIKEDKQFFNRLFFVTPEGVKYSYDKRHLFRMGQEDSHYTAGKKNVLIDYKGLKFKPQICYDLRFPVWNRNTQNCDVLYFVANWPERRIEHWRALLKARAIENQCYVIGVNRVGMDGNGINHNGASAVFDALGNCIVESMDNEEVIYTNLDLEALKTYKNNFPAWKDSDNFNVL